jgi:hypothetical protein
MSLRDAINASSGNVDPFVAFLSCDNDQTSDPNYFGFVSANGAWIIKRMAADSSTIRYAGGSYGYAAAWADRANLTYTLPAGG